MGREIPILMSGPLVRATLEGAKPEYARSYPAKTQTRRPIRCENKPDPGFEWAECLCRDPWVAVYEWGAIEVSR